MALEQTLPVLNFWNPSNVYSMQGKLSDIIVVLKLKSTIPVLPRFEPDIPCPKNCVSNGDKTTHDNNHHKSISQHSYNYINMKCISRVKQNTGLIFTWLDLIRICVIHYSKLVCRDFFILAITSLDQMAKDFHFCNCPVVLPVEGHLQARSQSKYPRISIFIVFIEKIYLFR